MTDCLLNNTLFKTSGNRGFTVENIMDVMIIDKTDKTRKNFKIESDQEFDFIEDIAKGFDFPVCIKWSRASDGQVAYWSPRGVSFGPHWYNQSGGAMPGAGAPTKPEQLKKNQVSLQLPLWMIAKLDEMKPLKRQAIIEQALLEKFGWQPPTVD